MIRIKDDIISSLDLIGYEYDEFFNNKKFNIYQELRQEIFNSLFSGITVNIFL